MGCTPSSPDVLEPKQTGTASHTSFEKLYDVKGQLGKGSFAKVCLCMNKKSKSVNAVKILKKSCEIEEERAANELEAWKRVGVHDNVVVLLETYVESGVNYFVMPQCKCTLNEMLMWKGIHTYYADMLDAFRQIFLGLQHCHATGVAHRDMKAQNFLVDFDGVVKIADFGLATSVPEGGLNGIVGSVPYMSPEMVKAQPYGFKTDVWSCGVSVYLLVYGRYPYQSSCSANSERKANILKAIKTNVPKPAYQPIKGIAHPPALLQELVKALLQRKAQARPEARSCADMIMCTIADLKKEVHGSRAQKNSCNVDLFDDSASTDLPSLRKEQDESDGLLYALSCGSDFSPRAS